MKRLNGIASLVFVITVVSGGVAGAVTLNVVGGQLVGASGVDVGGTLYDVEFSYGTCVEVFSGCSESSLVFSTSNDALEGAQALLDQVFLDVVEGQFDADPSLTRGCESATDNCVLIVPWERSYPESYHDLLVVTARNGDPSISDQVASTLPAAALVSMYSNTDSGTFARFSAVPEPSTALLLGIGLSALAVRREKQ